ncbi:hypothetical protein [Herbidospora sp. NBRC 101105]|uniref:hypothetical protein n=1 Tax=Herbidospora sp. NBRC 101105 TaxID=3032195 RepID=UPI0024A03947|nr:hypothetical protein [Herbidospora sp. NBRC 101105]GLX95458.1 hypothetical protein Hesp01_34080 [Herbidospora sp. NBRC 101105]
MAENMYFLGDEDRKKFARLIAVTWADGELQARYESEPRVVLSEFGITFPDDAPIPPLPSRPRGEFDVTELEFAAGAEGGALATISSTGCISPCVACTP